MGITKLLLAPLYFLRWVVGLGIRALFTMAIVGLIGFGLLRYFDILPARTASPERGAPSVAEAPWAVQTSSRVYYAESYTQDGALTFLVGYWELQGRGRKAEWVRVDYLELDAGFGGVQVYRRVGE